MSVNPLPGDPSYVAAQASAMTSAAAKMTSAATSLRRLTATHFKSDAYQELAENADQTAEVLDRAAERYSGTGKALGSYATVLHHAQQRANVAIAALNQTDVWSAQQQVNQLREQSRNPILLIDASRQAERDRLAIELASAENDLASQQKLAGHAVSEYEAAQQEVNTAASAAIEQIHTAVESSRLNDGAWEKFSKFMDKLAEFVATITEVLGTILSVIALLTCWIPVIGQLVLVAALLVTLAGLAASAWQFARGDKSLGAFMLDAGFAVLACIPGGKVIGKGVKAVAKSGLAGSIKKAFAQGSKNLTKKKVAKLYLSEKTGKVDLPGLSTKGNKAVDDYLKDHPLLDMFRRDGEFWKAGRDSGAEIAHKLSDDQYDRMAGINCEQVSSGGVR